MAGFTADTSAAPRLADQLHAAGVQLGELGPANAEAGRVVITATRPPRSTGFMADNLTAAVAPNGVTFASAARYWTYVHWGAPRNNQRARPFFAEALPRATDEVVEVYAEHARAALDKIG